ncbi:hypothetical protein ACFLRF_01330 [Candidatus Altiarchaeota archaeon]
MNKKLLLTAAGAFIIVALLSLIVAIAWFMNPSEQGPARIDTDFTRINTVGWQDSVFISPDGNELYFAYMPYTQKTFMDLFFGRITEEDVVRRGPERPGNHGSMSFDTYVAARKGDGSWGTPANLNINSDHQLYSAKISFDGKELYYAIRDYDKNYGADDIYYSRKMPDGSWSPPENLGHNINTQYREDHPALSPDGQTLYFTRSRQEMLGIEIWAAKRVEGGWSKAVKLPEPVNQPNAFSKANHQPFMAAGGRTLYFTRMWKLHKSTLLDDGSWSEPEVVLPGLEVSGHASVTADGRRLYYITAKEHEAFIRHEWVVVYSEKREDGSWGEPIYVD